MVTHRERLRERGLTQLSVWLPDDTARLIKATAERLGLSLPKLIERAVIAYQPASNPPDYADEIATTLTALTARITALESERQTTPPNPFPKSGERARAALRDPAIIELHKRGLKYADIQAELFQRGITANGKDGQPTPISIGVISTVIKKAG
jgi:hypothetical protein